MKIIGMTLVGLYVIAAKALASPASGDAAGPKPVDGTAIICKEKGKKTSSVSQPNTTVAVTCGTGFTLKPAVSGSTGKDVCFDEQCNKEVELSSVCPGASIAKASNNRGGETKVNVRFPQLPTTQQVVYLKCEAGSSDAMSHDLSDDSSGDSSGDCTAIITVEPASPQGPQACAVLGKSVTLQVNQAGGSAQFGCGGNLALAPSGPTEAYADDCSKVETLKDMTRTDKPGDYSTLTVNKLRKKKLCYLCGQGGAPEKRAGESDRCTIYVEVGGTTRFSSSVFFGLTLPCLAAVLGFV